MLSEDGEYQICDEPDCVEKIKNHAWGRIKAEGWFSMRSGEIYCPNHIPDWVSGWRKKKLDVFKCSTNGCLSTIPKSHSDNYIRAIGWGGTDRVPYCPEHK